MCWPDRNTDSRGRPPDLWRNWKRRRTRRRVRSSCSVLMCACLLAPGVPQFVQSRHGGTWPRHPRLSLLTPAKSWMPTWVGLTMQGTSSLLLPFLAADLFVGVADALALIRLRPAETADLRC